MTLVRKTMPPHEKPNLLLVDDRPENLLALETVLEDLDCHIFKAMSGPEVLRLVLKHDFALVFLDVQMPEMDGFEVAELLRRKRETQHIPIIFVTAISKAQHYVFKGYEKGAVDYLFKPLDPSILRGKASVFIELYRQKKLLEQQAEELEQRMNALEDEIVKRELAEEELRKLNQQLQQANASKDTFFSIIAHDLRNPFTGLITLTEAIVEEFDSYSEGMIKAMIRRLHTSSKTVYALLTNLLQWSRLQRGLVEYEPELCSLTGIAERNMRLFALDAERKQVTLKNLIPLGMTAYADHKMIDTIMRNLISNALKFTDTGGIIEISSAQHNNSVNVIITDTGIGMDQESIDKLFRIDVKYSKAGTAGEQGTGLGLLLCKDLIDKNNGRIGVESDIGKGSRFIISLPCNPPILSTKNSTID